jgi:hypothetical protein
MDLRARGVLPGRLTRGTFAPFSFSTALLDTAVFALARPWWGRPTEPEVCSMVYIHGAITRKSPALGQADQIG